MDIAGGPPKGKLLPLLSLPSTGSAWRLFAAISLAGPPADPSWRGVQAERSRSHLRPEPGRPGSEGWLCHFTGLVCSPPGGSASSPTAWGDGACLRGGGGMAWAPCAAQPGCPGDAYTGAPRVFSQIQRMSKGKTCREWSGPSPISQHQALALPPCAGSRFLEGDERQSHGCENPT